MNRSIPRRDFLKTSAAATSLAVWPIKAFEQGDETQQSDPGEKSRVVEVAAPGLVGSGRRPDEKRLAAMVDRAILTLTGEARIGDAWSYFAAPDDVVGIKLNSGGGRLIATKCAILRSVVDGLLAADVPEENIVVWDQIGTSVKEYARRNGIEDWKVEFRGCTPKLGAENFRGGKPLDGFTGEPVSFPWGKIKVADLVLNELTAIINLPVLKDHSAAGVTLALKNVSHAIVDRPWTCHANGCDPYIADINAIPAVREKVRVHILDAVFGVADGGPVLQSLKQLFVKERLLASADAVALDTIARDWIAEARREMGYPPLEEAANQVPGVKGRSPNYIATAAARGLGVNDPSRIEQIRLEVPVEKDSQDAAG